MLLNQFKDKNIISDDQLAKKDEVDNSEKRIQGIMEYFACVAANDMSHAPLEEKIQSIEEEIVTTIRDFVTYQKPIWKQIPDATREIVNDAQYKEYTFHTFDLERNLKRSGEPGPTADLAIHFDSGELLIDKDGHTIPATDGYILAAHMRERASRRFRITSHCFGSITESDETVKSVGFTGNPKDSFCLSELIKPLVHFPKEYDRAKATYHEHLSNLHQNITNYIREHVQSNKKQWQQLAYEAKELPETTTSRHYLTENGIWTKDWAPDQWIDSQSGLIMERTIPDLKTTSFEDATNIKKIMEQAKPLTDKDVFVMYAATHTNAFELKSFKEFLYVRYAAKKLVKYGLVC